MEPCAAARVLDGLLCELAHAVSVRRGDVRGQSRGAMLAALVCLRSYRGKTAYMQPAIRMRAMEVSGRALSDLLAYPRSDRFVTEDEWLDLWCRSFAITVVQSLGLIMHNVAAKRVTFVDKFSGSLWNYASDEDGASAMCRALSFVRAVMAGHDAEERSMFCEHVLSHLLSCDGCSERVRLVNDYLRGEDEDAVYNVVRGVVDLRRGELRAGAPL